MIYNILYFIKTLKLLCLLKICMNMTNVGLIQYLVNVYTYGKLIYVLLNTTKKVI